MSNKKDITINNMSKHLFWDVDSSTLDINKDFRFILARVLDYGLINDWLLLYKHYGLKKITTEAKKIRSMSNKSLHFIANLSNTKLQEFRCYTYKQSIPGHWNS